MQNIDTHPKGEIMALPTQGVMLSERPSACSSATGGEGPVAGAGSIGNYKGVMLCNRPFAGTAAAAKGGDMVATMGKQVFVTGKVKSEVGFASRNMRTDKLMRKRDKQETALTRHRRWLADLQRTKQALEDQFMHDQQKKEDTKKRFAEREARMRQMSRELEIERNMQEQKSEIPRDGSEGEGHQGWAIGLGEDTDGIRKSKNRREPTERKVHSNGTHSAWDGETEYAELRAAEKRRKRDGKPCRPMWAMTESKAEAETELKHEEELEVTFIRIMVHIWLMLSSQQPLGMNCVASKN